MVIFSQFMTMIMIIFIFNCVNVYCILQYGFGHYILGLPFFAK